jgi:hypothetical protein
MTPKPNATNRRDVMLALGAGLCGCGRGQRDSDWKIYIAGDACSDYTWGFDESQTRRNFAELVRAHLDEMTRTDRDEPDSRARYNMSVIQEALCFLEAYPERRAELARRVKEGRIFASPFLNNSLWGFQSTESAIRTLYPARRLEREWGIRMRAASHIELPSLPWGMASILAGCGVEWLLIHFLNYDTTFSKLAVPPVFRLEGPDGRSIGVILDQWACIQAGYRQGDWLLKEPARVAAEFLPHYRALGETYPLTAVLAGGTHGDTTGKSAARAAHYSQAISGYNRQPGEHPRLVNATLTQFVAEVEKQEREDPFLVTVRGCFGHSWELWPVSLAAYAAALREGERRYLAAEALLSVVSLRAPEAVTSTRQVRERAEWCWTMLADHAWNGPDEANKRVNAGLRKSWSSELNQSAAALEMKAWDAAGLQRTPASLVLFNPLSFARRELIRVESTGLEPDDVASQKVVENGRQVVYFVPRAVKGFGFETLTLAHKAKPAAFRLWAAGHEMEGPFYRIRLNAQTGAVESILWRPEKVELVTGAPGVRTTYFEGSEHSVSAAKIEVVTAGPVLARMRVAGALAGKVHTETFITLYADLDRLDFEFRVRKPAATGVERLCHIFPVAPDGAVLRAETTGAVMRPSAQPAGHLLPGADTRRLAVQGFVDLSQPQGHGVSIAPLDAFALLLDYPELCFEVLGNDQNHKEVLHDQDGVTEFRFRYALRGHQGAYDGRETTAWSRSVAYPMLTALGAWTGVPPTGPNLEAGSPKVLATCLKPADDLDAGGLILRLWETSGRTVNLRLPMVGFRRATRTDLLERDIAELPAAEGAVSLKLPAYGFAAVRLIPG